MPSLPPDVEVSERPRRASRDRRSGGRGSQTIAGQVVDLRVGAVPAAKVAQVVESIRADGDGLEGMAEEIPAQRADLGLRRVAMHILIDPSPEVAAPPRGGYQP